MLYACLAVPIRSIRFSYINVFFQPCLDGKKIVEDERNKKERGGEKINEKDDQFYFYYLVGYKIYLSLHISFLLSFSLIFLYFFKLNMP